MQSRKALLLLSWVIAAGCSDSAGLSLTPRIDQFTVPTTEQTKIKAAAEQGSAAEASYAYDATSKKLTIDISASGFKCGIEKGRLVAQVTELSATNMVWQFEGAKDTTRWTRVDQGTSGIVGVWFAAEGELYLIVTADNKAQLFGKGEECVAERARHPQSNCLEVPPASTAISIDGDLADWSSVGTAATLNDDLGDQSGADAGGDIKALKLAYADNAIYIYLQLAAAPSTDFGYENGKSYRLTVQGDNGISFVVNVYYDASRQSWQANNTPKEITFAVGSEGIEWRVDVSAYAGQGFKEVERVMVEAREAVDFIDCAWFKVP
ncbi:MAG: hypothetical protein H6707_20750 [Deltaproteobacteria bacterium]|nr:hypothetical protein [Deltaproteobacteria bacterium]